jgi:ABC-type glycerol-3-phosphate transport system substrate-binding protein
MFHSRLGKAQRGAIALFATVTLGLTATGCGGSSEPQAEDGPPSGEIRALSFWSGPEGEAFQAVVDGFEAAYPEASVKIESVPFDQIQSVLTQQFAAGNPPDTAVALPGMVRQLSEQGLLMDVDDLWDTWIEDGQYNDSLRAIAEGSEGTTNAVYVKGNVNGLIWHTTEQAEELGISTPPASWAEFTAVLDKYKATGSAPFSVGAKDVWVPTQWMDPILLNVAGEEKFNQLARGEIGWDDPDVTKAVTVLATMIKNYWPKNALDTGFSDETCGWVKGNNAFANNGAFVNGIVPSCDESLEPGTDYTFFTLPPFEGSETPAQAVSGDLFVGAEDSENPATTRAFLEYLGSVEAQSIWAERGGYIAPNMQVPSDVYPTANDQAAAELWPKDAEARAGYDLDDWIGGELQSQYRNALVELVRTQDAEAFTQTMTAADTRSNG